MKNNYRIVASDLDGTLLGRDQLVSDENLKAIAEMTRLGVEFVPTTGRSLGEIPEILMKSSFVRYIITSDGAALWDKTLGKMIITQYIPADVVKFIIDTVNAYGNYKIVHENGKTYYDEQRYTADILDACHMDDAFRNIIRTRGLPKNEFNDFIMGSNSVEMFCIFFKSIEELEECRRVLLESGKLSVAQSASYNLEICLSSAGKGNALSALAKALGVEISDIIAVGDSTNDSSLIKTAGLGLAMENACDELKVIADKIICNNSEHSAKYILENYIIK